MRNSILACLAILLILPLALVPPIPAAAAPLAWETLQPLAEARHQHTTTLLADGRLLVAGGTTNPLLASATAELYDPMSGQVTPAASMYYTRYGHTATLLPDGRVLVAGGMGYLPPDSALVEPIPLDNAELYDPALDAWTLLPAPMHAARAGHTATLLADGRVLLAFGQSGANAFAAQCETYDFASQTFTPLPDPIIPGRRGHTATRLLDGSVLIAGGYIGYNLYANDATIFDPASDTFLANTAPLTGERSLHTATLLNDGKVLVVGGEYYADGIAYRADSQLYDPAQDAWSPKAPIPIARALHSATRLPDGRVLVAGGFDGATYLADTRIYTPSTNTWSPADALTTPRREHTAVLLHSGSVVVAGGISYDPATITIFVTASLERFDPKTGAVTNTGALNNDLIPAASTVLPSGKVMVIGGKQGSTFVGSAEQYNPGNGSWTVLVSMLTARDRTTATLLPDGRLLVAGGLNGSGVLSTCELYNPTSGTWDYAAPMASPRAAHTATLLADGRVLVVGGFYNTDEKTSPSAEIYDPRRNLWTPAAPPLQPRQEHRALLLADGRVMTAGGLVSGTTGTSYLSHVELYDPALNAWQATDPLAVKKIDFTLSLLPDGSALAAGGRGDGYYAELERYHVSSGLWTNAGAFPSPRAGHSATLTFDGRLLFAGGYVKTNEGTTYLSEIKIFDPPTGSLYPVTATLGVPRAYHLARPLRDGSVLFISGKTASDEDRPTCERYARSLGFLADWQPVIQSLGVASQGGRLRLTGARFEGLGEASGGGTQNASSGMPALALYRLDNEQLSWVGADPRDAFSPTALTSAPLAGVPQGPALALLYANGIPSEAAYLTVRPYLFFTPILNR